MAIANKKNKSLVKSMSEYIGVAMEQSGGGGGGGGGGAGGKTGERNSRNNASSKTSDGAGGKTDHSRYAHK